jgi:hypothetical protein
VVSRTNQIVSRRLRWFAISTGCFAAIALTVALGPAFALMPSLLILGALLQPIFPRLGRGLICAGALWMSFWVFDVGILMARETRFADHPGVISLTLASVVVVAWCDWAIVSEELKMRSNAKLPAAS